MSRYEELLPEAVAVLRKAADHMEATGFYQGTWFENTTAPLAERSCCALGAIGYEAGYWYEITTDNGRLDYDNQSVYEPGTFRVKAEAARAHDLNEIARWALGRSLAIHYPDETPLQSELYVRGGTYKQEFVHPPEWNDVEGRTQEQVLTALRTTAQELESGALGTYPAALQLASA